MAYYVDIGVDEGIGNKSGSDPSNYMGWNQFAYLSSDYLYLHVSNNDYLIRGSRTTPAAYGLWAVSGHFKSWNKAAYGPWRLYCTEHSTGSGFQFNYQGASSVSMEDGILASYTNLNHNMNSPTSMYLGGMVFRAYGSTSASQVNIATINFNCSLTLKGCRFYVGGLKDKVPDKKRKYFDNLLKKYF